MSQESNDLELRLKEATPQDSVRGMIFNGAITTVRQTVGDAAADACLVKLKNPKWVDLFAYPVTDFLRLTWVAAEAMVPKTGSHAASVYLIGHSAATSFLGSAVGKTLKTLVASDPRKMLVNLPTSYRLATSFGERSVTFKGQRDAVFHSRRDFLPKSFHEGVLTAALGEAGGRNVKAEGHDTGLLDNEFNVSWEY